MTGMPTAPGDAAPVPREPRRAWIAVLLALLAVAIGVGVWRLRLSPRRPAATAAIGAALDDTLARAPAGQRVIVRVINASGVRGLGRRATLVLRDFGYDVVDFDGIAGGARETSEVVDHTGHPAWARHLQRALGTGSISARADSSRYVDLTVFIGRDWQVPSQPLRP